MFVSCVHSRVVEGSWDGIAGCVVHVAVQVKKLKCVEEGGRCGEVSVEEGEGGDVCGSHTETIHGWVRG